MVPDDPRIELSDWVHDFLYEKEGKIFLEGDLAVSLSRKQTDEILTKKAMPDLLSTAYQRSVVYQAITKLGKQRSGNSFSERFS